MEKNVTLPDQQAEVEPCWDEEVRGYRCTGDCPYPHTQEKRQFSIFADESLDFEKDRSGVNGRKPGIDP